MIEPGRAFGTGHHGTTAGCLTLLETLIARDRPTRALDLGTGSGILAVAAARLGVDGHRGVRQRSRRGRRGRGQRQPQQRHRARAPDARGCGHARRRAGAAGPRQSCWRRPTAHSPGAIASSSPVGGALVLGGLLDAEADGVADALTAHGFARGGVGESRGLDEPGPASCADSRFSLIASSTVA